MYAHINMHLNGIICGSLLFQCFYLKHHSPWLSLNYAEWLLLVRALKKTPTKYPIQQHSPHEVYIQRH